MSLFIDMGFSDLAIADRVWHESVGIIYHYAHLFLNRQLEVTDQIDIVKNEKGV